MFAKFLFFFPQESGAVAKAAVRGKICQAEHVKKQMGREARQPFTMYVYIVLGPGINQTTGICIILKLSYSCGSVIHEKTMCRLR